MALGLGFAGTPVIARLAVALGLDAGGFEKGMKDADQKLDKSASKFQKKTAKVQATAQKMMPAALAIGGALAAGAVKGVSAASDLEEALNKGRVTFGAWAKEVPGMSGSVAKSLGISRAAAIDQAAGIGAMTRAMGSSRKEAAFISRAMLKAAADMGSFHNADPTDMLDRLRAGLSGESEPLKKFGVLLNEQRVKLKAVEMGLLGNVRQTDRFKEAQFRVREATEKLIKIEEKHGKSSNEAKKARFALNKAETKAGDILEGQGVKLSDQQKLLARYHLILDDTAVSADDFANTSNSLANRQRILKARFEDLSAKLGKQLLPAAEKLVAVGVRILDFFDKNTILAKILIGVLATFSGLVLATAASMKVAAGVMMVWRGATAAWAVAMKIATAAQWLFNAAVAANPLVLLVTAVVALGLALVIAYKRSEKFRKIVDKTMSLVMKAGKAVLGFFKREWKKIAVFISGPFAPLVLLATDAFGIRSKMIGAMNQLMGRAKTIATATANVIRIALTAPMRFGQWLREQIIDKMTALMSRIRSTAETIARTIIGAIRQYAQSNWRFWSTVVQRFVLDPIKNGISRIKSLGESIGRGLMTGMKAGISAGVKAPMNALINFINRVTGAVGTKGISDFLPFVSIPAIPQFARGGITSSPTLGIFGEAGPEALIPLSRGKKGHAVPLLQQAAQAHGLSLNEFGFGGIVGGAINRFNPANVGVDVLGRVFGGASGIVGKLPGLPDRIGPSVVGGDIGRGIGKHVLAKSKDMVGDVVQGVIGKITGGLFGGGGGGGDGGGKLSSLRPGILKLWAILQGVSGAQQVSSGFRAGSITKGGNVSLHASGRAIDIVGANLDSVALLARQIMGHPAQVAGATRNHIGEVIWKSMVGGNHFDHVHAGLFGGFPSLDSGGRVVSSGLAEVHPGDVHMGRGGGHVNIDLRGAQFFGSNRDVARQLADEIGPYLDERVTLSVAN